MAGAHRSLSCPRCSGSMESGYIVDEGYGTRTVAKWIRGEPERSMWTGLKMRGKDTVDITTYRCTRCGFLESYA
ncbi:MAG TPA: PF20097 family protein [Sphingomicrobium sp.]|nr:PF20097 family protein [Sphingomicrobium sp.]